MGLLEDLLSGAARGQGMGGRNQPQGSGPASGGNSALVALLPIILAVLASRGQSQGGRTGTGGSAWRRARRRTGTRVLGGGARQGGGLGDVLGQVLGGGSQRGGGLGDVLGQVLGGGGAGGLGGLLQKFEQNGMGAEAHSWVGTTCRSRPTRSAGSSGRTGSRRSRGKPGCPSATPRPGSRSCSLRSSTASRRRGKCPTTISSRRICRTWCAGSAARTGIRGRAAHRTRCSHRSWRWRRKSGRSMSSRRSAGRRATRTR